MSRHDAVENHSPVFHWCRIAMMPSTSIVRIGGSGLQFNMVDEEVEKVGESPHT